MKKMYVVNAPKKDTNVLMMTYIQVYFILYLIVFNFL
jgi:hypothetical protein